jgi:hypothetical protein
MERRTVQFALAALFLLGTCGCDTAKEAERLTQLKEEIRAKQADFATKHNAVVNWLDSKAGFFTLEFQNALIRQDGRPILESVFLEDIRRDAEGHVAQFSSRSPLSECRWQLGCTPEQAQALMEGGSYTSYLIIARVSSVSVKGVLISHGVEDKRVILIRGQLIDYLKE